MEQEKLIAEFLEFLNEVVFPDNLDLVSDLVEEVASAPAASTDVNLSAPVAESTTTSSTENSFLLYGTNLFRFPASAGLILTVQTSGGVLAQSFFVKGFVFFSQFFFKCLFVVCGGVVQLVDGFIVPLIVFCPVILALLASVTSSDIIYKTIVPLLQRFQFAFVRLLLMKFFVILAAPYRRSPLDQH